MKGLFYKKFERHKFALIIFIILFTTFIISLCLSRSNYSQLDLAIMKAYNLKTSEYTEEFIISRESIGIFRKAFDSIKIESLDGIEKFENLKSLSIEGHAIKDISAIEMLVKLEDLNLNQNEIQDISSLKKLTNLRWLKLDGNKITDITPLNKCIKLVKFSVANNEVCTVGDFSALNQLIYVSMRGNNLETDIGLETLSADTLEISFNNISDISKIVNAAKMNYVVVDYNYIDPQKYKVVDGKINGIYVEGLDRQNRNS